MPNLFAQEQWIQHRKNGESINAGDSDVYETFTADRGELYRAMQREYGRCISKCYINDGQPIGWVFQKRKRFDDVPETYILETWVSVHTAPPTHSVEHHYAEG